MLKIYNTISGKKEALKTRKNNLLELFVCGPTVYDSAHLGHARTYLVFDMIAKYLKEKGRDVFYLQNITDIDDKIINRAKETGATCEELARHFEKDYLEDMQALKVNSVTKYARATEYIKEIISQIKRLKNSGYAYQINDGIYYDISKFKRYGKLSKRTILQAEDAVSRIDQAINKRNKGDFCLWKVSKVGEPTWDFKTGKYLGVAGLAHAKASAGKPGWHIEDTAITEKFFGSQYDIHGGGRDLMFPHHEAEIAQMEAVSGRKPMVKYWLHTGFLTVNGQKMSKSLGNFVTIRDFVNKHSPRILRFLILKNHYRSSIDYGGSSVLQAEKELERIDAFLTKIKEAKRERQNKSLIKIFEFQANFEKAIKDDFNTPKAIAAIFELISRGNYLHDQNLLFRNDAENILKFFKKIDGFLNFIFWPAGKLKIPQDILNLVKQRQQHRAKKNWQKADEVRLKIQGLGWLIEDSPRGPKLKKLGSQKRLR